MNERVESLYETLASISPSIHHAVDGLERDIEAKQQELKDLREAHVQAVKILRAVDPDSVPEKPKSGKKPLKGVAPETLKTVEDWLRSIDNGEPFVGNPLSRRPDCPTSQATLSAALNVLAERGVLRLDSRGSGGAKRYKLAAPQ